MKYLILVLIFISCNQSKKYTKKTNSLNFYKPDIFADESGRTYDSNKLFSGNLKNSKKINFHKNQQCSSLIVSLNSTQFNSGYSISLDEGINNIFYEIITNEDKSICFGLIRSYDKYTLGSLSSIQSEWVVEKKTVSPDVAENNKITFFAKDSNDNPISGLDVAVDLVDLRNNPVASVSLQLVDQGNGEYFSNANLNYSYKIKIQDGKLLSLTQRDIQDVIATNNPYCYEDGRESSSEYNDLGNGDSLDPYKICFASQLKSISNNCNSINQDACSKHYILMNNIDLNDWYSEGIVSDQEFILASDPSHPFTGNFNGNNLNISNYKYSQNLIHFRGMMGYIDSASIYDLNYSYEYSSSSSLTVGGLIYESSSSSLYGLEVEGLVSVGSSTLVGGLVYDALSLTFNDNEIDLNVTQGKDIGGFFYNISGSLGNNLYINKNYANLIVNHNSSINVGYIGGISSRSDFVDYENNHTDVNINTLNNVQGNVSGMIGLLKNGSVSHSYSVGSISDTDQGYLNAGGIAALVDGSSITNSFSLVNITTTDCLNKCGKIVGDTINPVSNMYSSLYSSSLLTFNLGSGFLNSSVVENDESSYSYFYDSLNIPMDSFDNSIWNFDGVSYPSLN